MSTGALDLAYTPALSPAYQMPRSLAEHVMDIIAHRRRHPYAVLGLERVIPALQSGFDALRDALDGTALEPAALDLEAENLLLPSSLGALMPAGSALAPHLGASFAAGLQGTWGVLGLAGYGPFNARRIARALAADAESYGVAAPELVPIQLAGDWGVTPVGIARRLDDQAHADALARELERSALGFDGIIAPPLLGLERHDSVRRRLSDAAGAPVVEALAHMPSVPGIRLQRALERAVDRAGVARVGEISSTRGDGSRLVGAVTRDALEIDAGAFVLATGRFVAGGIEWKETCREALLDLPVVTEDGPMEEDAPHAAVRETPMESHPLMTAGVQVDETLHPIREGDVAFENLYAAGVVIGGFASRYALCADGVALASGWLAGTAAAQRGSREP
jgi:glycerol-3-phosphate dehydrogenase subunit B